MQTKALSKPIFIWLFIFLPLIGTFLFRKSFDLGLYGDDWQHLYILWRDFFVFHTKSFFDIRSYLNPYWPEYFYLGVIQHFWGYFPPSYFIVSYLMRVFANIALYFFCFELTKSKLAAFLTSFFFLVSAAGLQTTDWVFNMNTYAGLGLLAIASTIYLKIRQLKTFKSFYYPAFIITFTLALAIVPTRMHGAAPFIILMDLFLTFFVERQNFKFNRYLILRMVLPIVIFYTLIHFRSFGEESYAGGRFNDSYRLIQQLVQNGYQSWWLYFLAIIGHLALPDNVSKFEDSLTKNLVVEGLLSIILASISTFSILSTKKVVYYLSAIIFNISLFLFLKTMQSIDSHTSNDIYFAISLGGQFIFWAVWFFIIGKKKYPQIASTLIISIFWIVSLTILYWLFTPYYILETTGRYMSLGAAGMAIFLGGLSALLIKNSLDFISNTETDSKFLGSIYLGIPLLILSVFILTNFYVSQNYFNVMYQNRNKQLTEKTWASLLHEVPHLDKTAPSVFYFTTDNPTSLYGVLTFGFFMRAGLEWQIPYEALTPLPSTDYSELLEYVKTGLPLQKIHGRKAYPVPLSRIYAFDFKDGNLINITDQVHKKITEDLKLLSP